MSDTPPTVTPTVTFSDLVREAFIDPIRSVLIIDDQYPTWEQVFSEPGYHPDDTTRWNTKGEILELIKQFRTMSPALTVDIHDGQDNAGIESYLHQSDLLVLDYELEKGISSGDRSIEIIAKLLQNKHLNLVIVHTAISDLSSPFENILMSLLSPLKLDDQEISRGLRLVREGEDSVNNPDGTLADDLKRIMDISTYIAFRSYISKSDNKFGFILSHPSMAEFALLATRFGWKPNDQKSILTWGMSLHDLRVKEMGGENRKYSWNSPTEEKRGWIRTSGGFIAFCNKKDKNLLDILRSSIEEWRPTPSRLMSAKIRAEISRQGAGAEDSALTDKYAYWRYYQELRAAPPEGSRRKTLLEGYTARHFERLLDLIGSEALNFGTKVLDSDKAYVDRGNLGYSDNYSVRSQTEDERKNILAHYNAHISTKPVSGWHLHPGHIFMLGSDLWVCLSPVCDLVPLQKPSIAMHSSADAAAKPFIAVKLRSVKSPTSDVINSNTLIYLKRNEKIDIYSLFSDERTSPSPIWRMFIASNHGKIDIAETGTADLDLSYIRGTSGEIKIENAQVQIIGQLRYEYALNLIQKLGVEFTRIGLDFLSSSTPVEDHAPPL